MGIVKVAIMSGRSKLGYASLIAVFVALSVALTLLANEQANRRLFEADAYELISASPVPVVVCENHKIVLWNPAMELVTGKSAGEMIGQKTTIIVPDHMDERHATAIDKITATPGFGRGVRYMILPLDTQWASSPIKSLATVNHIRRHDGRVIMIARFEGFLMRSKLRWYDVDTNSFCRVTYKIAAEQQEATDSEK